MILVNASAHSAGQVEFVSHRRKSKTRMLQTSESIKEAASTSEDVALIHRLAACASPTGVFGDDPKFFQAALADYQREFAEMTSLR